MCAYGTEMCAQAASYFVVGHSVVFSLVICVHALSHLSGEVCIYREGGSELLGSDGGGASAAGHGSSLISAYPTRIKAVRGKELI